MEAGKPYPTSFLSRDKQASLNIFLWQRQMYKRANRNIQILSKVKDGTDQLTFLLDSTNQNKPKTWKKYTQPFSQSNFKVSWKSL